MTSLVLGTVVFDGWELPESIPFGGKQAHVIHRMIGGARVVDAMGPDDTNINWSGRFLGDTAELRARRVDLLRRSGRAVLLSWSSFVYRVLVVGFTGDFNQSHNIPYRIECLVIQDVVSDVVGPALQSLEDRIQADLAEALGATADNPLLMGVVAGIQTTIGQVLTGGRPTLASLSVAAMAGVQAAGAQAFTTASAAGVAADAKLGGEAGGMKVGDDPASLAQSVTTQSEAAVQSSAARRTAARLGRVNANVASALPLPPPPAPPVPPVRVDPSPLGAGFL